MKKIFNKSLLHGFLFAFSYSYIGYIFLISNLISFNIRYTYIPYVSYILEKIVEVTLVGFPVNFVIISIPVYFLLRRRTQNKTLYTCSAMFFSILVQIPMYIITAVTMPDPDYISNFARVITFYGLFAVLLAIILICTADIIVRMVREHKVNIPGIVSALTSLFLTFGFIITYIMLESIDYFAWLPVL